MILQNEPFQFSDLTERVQNIFQIKRAGTRPYEFKDRVHISISYEIDLDLVVTERYVYSVLDYIGDLGGLFDGLKLLFIGLIGVFNYNLYSSYMVTHLFKPQATE